MADAIVLLRTHMTYPKTVFLIYADLVTRMLTDKQSFPVGSVMFYLELLVSVTSDRLLYW